MASHQLTTLCCAAQLGGMVLHDGRVAEMKTGEGKTLVGTLPAYLHALKGEHSELSALPLHHPLSSRYCANDVRYELAEAVLQSESGWTSGNLYLRNVQSAIS